MIIPNRPQPSTTLRIDPSLTDASNDPGSAASKPNSSKNASKPIGSKPVSVRTSLDEALAPLADELPAREIERLRTAVSMLVGVESIVVLRDVLHLDHDEARAAGEWAVREMVRAVARSGDIRGFASHASDTPPGATRRMLDALRVEPAA